MADLPEVAVTGATGGLGGMVARHLAGAGLAQRLLVRDVTRAPELDKAAAAVCSYGDGEAARRALDGVKVLFMVSAAEAEDRSRAMLDQLGLHGFADHYPSTLSGGMRQRVALARTLVHEPDVLLLDEPFAALDFQSKLLIENDTAALVRQGRRSLLLITHDIEEAVSLADRVIVLSKRPTRIKAVYDIALGAERTDMIGLRQSPEFSHYIRRIWADLDVGLQ